jgi:hypothetical protein
MAGAPVSPRSPVSSGDEESAGPPADDAGGFLETRLTGVPRNDKASLLAPLERARREEPVVELGVVLDGEELEPGA